MIVTPKGEKIRSGSDDLFNILNILHEEDFNGYVEIGGRKGEDLISGTIIFQNGNPVIAGAENVKTNKKYMGAYALKLLLSLEKIEYNLFQLEEKDMKSIFKFNPPDTRLKLFEPKTQAKEETEIKPEVISEIRPVEFEEEDVVLKYISQLSNFTGLIKARASDQEMVLLLRDGDIVGAILNTNMGIIKGTPVLKYLSTKAKIKKYEKKPEDIDTMLSRSPEIRVVYEPIEPEKDVEELRREDLLRKYNIKPPSEDEIESVLDLEKADIFDFLKKNQFQKMKSLMESKR